MQLRVSVRTSVHTLPVSESHLTIVLLPLLFVPTPRGAALMLDATSNIIRTLLYIYEGYE